MMPPCNQTDMIKRTHQRLRRTGGVMTGSKARPAYWICLLLTAATVAVYLPAADLGFVNFDDPAYVTENPRVRSGLTGESLRWAFGATVAANWHPVTWLSHMLDVQVYGLEPGGHHLTSVLWHLVNTLLLFGVLRRGTGDLWPSALAAALFALHPLHVESVAWISERKDVLSTFFWMLAMGCYLRYAARPGLLSYGCVAAALVLGLMAKPMLVTLPFVLLLLDFWPLKRVGFSGVPWRVIAEKLPLLAVSAASCVVTFHVQQAGGAVRSLEIYPLTVRMANALVAYAGYMGKMVWPVGLTVLYPHPGRIPVWEVSLACLLLFSMTLLAVMGARRYPYVLFGWLWYLGTLVPVIGIVQVGSQAMADRYTYIPLVGLFVAAAWGARDLASGRRLGQPVAAAAAVVILAAFSVVAHFQVRVWADSIILLRHAVQVTTGNYVAHNNLGLSLVEAGRNDEAKDHFQAALRIRPGYIKSLNNLGLVFARQENWEAAIDCYERALRIKPDYATAHNNLGNALEAMGQRDAAISRYRRAIRIDPNHTEARNNLALALFEQGAVDEAVDLFNSVLRIKPYDAQVRNHLAIALIKLGRTEAAIAQFNRALALVPDYANAHYNLGLVMFRSGRFQSAIARFRRVLQIDPDHAGARARLVEAENLLAGYDAEIRKIRDRLRMHPEDAEAHFRAAALYRLSGRPAPAAAHLEQAVSLRPDDAEFLHQLGIVHAMQGDYEKAAAALIRARERKPDDAVLCVIIAGVFARQGRVDPAIRWLKTAVDGGFDDWNRLRQDENLANIRDTAYYRSLVGRR